MKTLRKARQQNKRRETRTFAGYIGLIDGRPDVDQWPNRERPNRVVHVFLNERNARRAYADVALVVITGVWEKSRKAERGTQP